MLSVELLRLCLVSACCRFTVESGSGGSSFKASIRENFDKEGERFGEALKGTVIQARSFVNSRSQLTREFKTSVSLLSLSFRISCPVFQSGQVSIPSQLNSGEMKTKGRKEDSGIEFALAFTRSEGVHLFFFLHGTQQPSITICLVRLEIELLNELLLASEAKTDS